MRRRPTRFRFRFGSIDRSIDRGVRHGWRRNAEAGAVDAGVRVVVAAAGSVTSGRGGDWVLWLWLLLARCGVITDWDGRRTECWGHWSGALAQAIGGGGVGLDGDVGSVGAVRRGDVCGRAASVMQTNISVTDTLVVGAPVRVGSVLRVGLSAAGACRHLLSGVELAFSDAEPGGGARSVCVPHTGVGGVVAVSADEAQPAGCAAAEAIDANAAAPDQGPVRTALAMESGQIYQDRTDEDADAGRGSFRARRAAAVGAAARVPHARPGILQGRCEYRHALAALLGERSQQGSPALQHARAVATEQHLVGFRVGLFAAPGGERAGAHCARQDAAAQHPAALVCVPARQLGAASRRHAAAFGGRRATQVAVAATASGAPSNRRETTRYPTSFRRRPHTADHPAGRQL
eukprot:ctg_528.g249